MSALVKWERVSEVCWEGRTSEAEDEYDRWIIRNSGCGYYQLSYAMGRVQKRSSTLIELGHVAQRLQNVLSDEDEIPGAQLQEALGIIDDLSDFYDSYVDYFVAHNNYNQLKARAISERISTLRLK